MKSGKLFGLVGAAAGVSVGTYLAVAPVLQGLKAGAMSGSDAGLSLAVVGAILGISCAAVAVIYNKFGASI